MSKPALSCFVCKHRLLTHLTLAEISRRRSCYSQQKSCTFVSALRPTVDVRLLSLVHSARCEFVYDQQTVSISPPPNLLPLQHPQECQSTVRSGSTSNRQLTVSKSTLKSWTNDLHHGVSWQGFAIIKPRALLASQVPVDTRHMTRLISCFTRAVGASLSKSIRSGCGILEGRVGRFKTRSHRLMSH